MCSSPNDLLDEVWVSLYSKHSGARDNADHTHKARDVQLGRAEDLSRFGSVTLNGTRGMYARR